MNTDNLIIIDEKEIVQLKEDINSLNDFVYPKNLNLYIYKSEEIQPNKALLNFKFSQIKEKDPYTLLLDCDEFIYSFLLVSMSSSK